MTVSSWILCLVFGAGISLGAQMPNLSVVRVVADPGCATTSHGSGVVVAPGVVATNAHVVQGGHTLKVWGGGQVYEVQAHILDPSMDLCLLKVPGLGLPSAPLALELPPLGTPLTALGFPTGAKEALVTTTGTLQATWHYRDGALLQMNTHLRPGNSGGGLFLPDGRLLGITSFALLASDQAYFAIPATWIRSLLAHPWQEARWLPVCKDREMLYFELLDHLTSDPRNRAPWEAFTRAWIQARQDDPEAWFSLGHVLLQNFTDASERHQGEVDPAMPRAFLEAFRKAVALRPGFVKSWNNLGVTLDLMGDGQGAIEAFQMAIRLKHDYALAWVNLGASYLQASRWEAASDALRKGLAGRPDDATAWYRLAFAEAQRRRWSHAAAAYRTTRQYQPFRKDLQVEYVHVLLKLKDKDALANLLQELETRQPERLPEIQSLLTPKHPKQ